MTRALRTLNAGMIAFDLVLGSTAIARPRLGLKALGHRRPTKDAEWLFRRCGPIWLTFAAAHAAAALRDEPRDWWALAWLRGTEIATDALWAQGPGFGDARARATMRLAGAANLGMALGFGALARQRANAAGSAAPRPA
jgi:hypothetical protein